MGYYGNTSAALDITLFLERFHSLFMSDFRITSIKDEWLFNDLTLLNVLTSGLRMSLRLFQDYFSDPEEFSQPSALLKTLDDLQKDLVLCNESDPLWRESILKEVPQLFTFRKAQEDPNNPVKYNIIMLELRPINFNVVKLNKECVRGLWAGQQHELVFLQNQNSERGSIQQLKTILRNIINQSCDLPVGYPAFVSPITTGEI